MSTNEIYLLLLRHFAKALAFFLQTTQDPEYRETRRWLGEQFKSFEFTNDARFETFRSYPKNKSLLQRHKDYARDYDRNLKFYKNCQRLFCIDINKQIQKTEDRFSRLIYNSFTSSQVKSKSLLYSYNKWKSSHEIRCEKPEKQPCVRDPVQPKNKPRETTAADREDAASHVSGLMEGSHPASLRQHSLRSVSVDNIPRAVRTCPKHVALLNSKLNTWLSENNLASDVYVRPQLNRAVTDLVKTETNVDSNETNVNSNETNVDSNDAA